MLPAAFQWGPDAPLTRYVASLGTHSTWLVAALALAVGFALLTRARMARSRAQALAMPLLLIVALGALLHAWELRWLADDAFISFRYARNWVSGHGLVFNPGERVEGYTNFLWTALMALAIGVRLDPGRFSIVLSFACLAGVLFMVTRLVRKLAPPGPRPVLPLAALLLAANYTFASYGSSGLETMAGALFVLLALERAVSRALLAAGVCGIVATLLHPDHALFYVGLGAALLLMPDRNWRGLARYAAPFLCGFVPYFLIRWHYYGDFYPNTYYAKSGGLAYFSQGAVYLWVSGLAAGAVGALPLAAYAAYVHRRNVAGPYLVIAVPLYLLYVAKIGGDFMLGRLLVPVLPLLFAMAEVGARELLARSHRFGVALAGLGAFTLAGMPQGVVGANEKYLHVADERQFYGVKRWDPLVVDSGFTNEANVLKSAFASSPRPPTLGVGCIGIVGWITNYPIMDNWGLANRSVAHQQVEGRGRPGHEKLATPGHAFEHAIDFSDISIWPAPYDAWAKLRLGGWDFQLARWDAPFLRALKRQRGVELPAIERRLREFAADAKDPARLACDHWFFEQLYFSYQPSASLRASVAARFVTADPSLAAVQALLLGAPAAKDPLWKARVLFPFDNLAGFTTAGDAFADDPSELEVAGQGRVFGNRGQYVSSARPKRLDKPTGSLISRPFVLRGEALTLLVAGGMQPETAEVRLRVGERIVARATGCNSEVFGRRIWATGAWKGQEARLEVVDEGTGGWQHILVDEVTEWEHTQ